MQQTQTISFSFQLMMLMLSTFFWILGWIPFVNIATNAIYWCIWAVVFFFRYLPILRRIASTGVSIGSIYLKLGVVCGFCFILGMIPIVSLVPWQVLSNVYVNRQIKILAKKVDQLKKDVETVQKGWSNRQRRFSMRRDGTGYYPTEQELAEIEDEEDLEEEEAEEEAQQDAAMAEEQNVLDLRQAQEQEERETMLAQEEEDPTLRTATGEDALDALNKKPDRTSGENLRLMRAAKILQTGQISPADRNDPVLMAAWQKFQSGVREYDPRTQKGYRIGNAPSSEDAMKNQA